MITKLILSCLVMSTTIISAAQDIARIKSISNNQYLNVETGAVQTSEIKDDWLSARWDLVKTADGHYNIVSNWKGDVLNLAGDRLQCTAADRSSDQAKWDIKKIEGSDAVRIYNVADTALAINVEKGTAAATTIGDDWPSAKWVLVMMSTSTAGGPSSNPTFLTMNEKAVLEAHNKLRREVGVPDLVWSNELAARAQTWAYELAKKNMGEFVLEHSQTKHIGENIVGGFVQGRTPDQAVTDAWGDNEKPNFDPNTRKCIGDKECGHYTQVVWRNTTQVGCAIAVNPNGKYLLICNYSPPGNFNNQPAF
ncbi:MAG: CAP domain-containing protein [Bacteroidota bacterium]